MKKKDDEKEEIVTEEESAKDKNAEADKDESKDKTKDKTDDGDDGKEEAADVSSDDDEEEPAYIPGKKKGRGKWIALAVVAVLIILFFISRNRNRDTAFVVETMEASTGSIEETVTISGTVASAEKKAYFSEVSATVGTLPISAGDRVNKGDLLYSYDDEDLALQRRQAELSIQQADGNYSGSIEKNAKATDVLRGNSTHDINNRLDEITAEIDAINYKITEKTDRMSQTLTELQQVAMDINQNGIADSYEAAYTAEWNNQNDGDASVNNDYITRLQNGEGDPDVYANEENQQMYLSVQQNIAGYQYALQHDDEIEEWQRQITALNEERSTLQEQKSVEASRLTSGDKSALEAGREMTELSSNNTISDIDAVDGGVRADFAGVVTEVTVEEGMTVAKGTRMLSLSSTDDVEVDIQISKADMTKVQVGQAVDITVNGREYTGEVTQISGSAARNTSGVPVVDAKIKINDPDDELILGVESSNKIHTNKADGVIVIPYEYIGSDSEGDFVYIYGDGAAHRRGVTLGLTTSTLAEVTSGLSAGDLVITTDFESLSDGMAVTLSE